MKCQISEIEACNIFIMSTLSTGFLFCSEDHFQVFYNVLMCLMYLHNVLLNGQDSHWANYLIELLNIILAAHVYICNTRFQFITTINNVSFV